MKFFNFKITKRKIMIIAALVIFISLAVFFFYPRNLSDVCHCPTKLERIDITDKQIGYSVEDDDVICLHKYDVKKLTEVIENTRIYRNPVFKKLNNGGSETINLYIYFQTQDRVLKTPLRVHIFTEDILIIDGVQYRIYGKEFIETMNSLIN